MKTKTLLLALVAFCFILISCEKNKEKSKSTYVDLECVDFFKLTNSRMVDSIASIMNIKPFTYLSITTNNADENVELITTNWIKEGKKYTNSDGQTIILWVDSLDNLAIITYLYYRFSNTNSWNNTEIQLNNTAKTLFAAIGFVQKPNEEYSIMQASAGIQHKRWYNLMCRQTIHADTIKFPELHAEIEGDTCRINFLMIPVWYTNLNDINVSWSDNEMANIANSFIITKYGGSGYTIGNEGYQIVSNKLCKAFGAWVIDGRGRYMVYIDVQTGEIVYNTII